RQTSSGSQTGSGLQLLYFIANILIALTSPSRRFRLDSFPKVCRGERTRARLQPISILIVWPTDRDRERSRIRPRCKADPIEFFMRLVPVSEGYSGLVTTFIQI